MQRLTPLATAFLDAEDADPQASLAIGSFAVFAGPAPSFAEITAAIGSRLPLIPRYRQRLRAVPFRLAAPAWVDDPDFDLRRHVHLEPVPPPGGRQQLAELFSRLMTRRMDRDRPLWDYWFCPGLPGGRWGLVSKLHHSMADGISGSQLYHLVLDASPGAAPPLVDDWLPRPPSGLSFTAQALVELARTPGRQLAGGLRAAGSPLLLASRAGRFGQGLLTMTGALRPVRPTSLAGPLCGQRRYAWTSCGFGELQPVRHRFGVTVNDVAMAAITGGFRRLLIARGEQPAATSLRSLVPVSTREAGAEQVQDNRISLLLPYLPVELPDAADRLRTIAGRLAALRRAHEADAGADLTSLAAASPFLPVTLGIRLGWRLPQHQVATVTTNVPGPRATLYCLGRPLLEILPYVPIADRLRTGVAIFSYRRGLTFGITADREAVPDVEVLAAGIRDSLTELRELAEPATGLRSAGRA
ncbi:MAG TPA: wax ester/triacylglycerol synthase family O-acyltransferase [Jatrophihabitans sp.]|nr:wax ester/triacylglycerol synthase family O-acyltransferase [Jatrophihabitans sp.]